MAKPKKMTVETVLRQADADDASDDLREAIFATYAQIARHEQAQQPYHDEHTRRGNAVRFIQEILQHRDLMSFSAAHLETLELCFAYWREVEVAPDAPVNAPEPEGDAHYVH
jgi:hypothetical protein